MFARPFHVCVLSPVCVSGDRQTALQHLLQAYSIHDLAVGYCQGMNFLAAFALTQLPEEVCMSVRKIALYFCFGLDSNPLIDWWCA
jgi:hypothetical protein